MTNRREVMKSGLLALAPASAWTVAAAAPEPVLFRAVYDERFAEGRAFAESALVRGWPARAIQGDVTRLWYDELDPRWRRGPAAIAGLTTPMSLFCLETLARDKGMRLAARADLADAGLVRWLIAPRRGARA